MVDMTAGRSRDARVVDLAEWRARMDERERLKREIAQTIRRLRECGYREPQWRELPDEVWQRIYRIVRYAIFAAALAGALAAALVLALAGVLH